jgi:amylosucrase
MGPEARARHAHALTRIHGDDAFLRRFERFFTELHDPLHAVYGRDPRFPGAWDALLELIAASAAARDPALRALDHEREITPDWLHREQTVGYVAYVDRFAGTLQGVRERLGYLRELGVTYLHLMPLLRTRPEPNDGGYAVTDYGAVEPALGTIEDLRELATDLRAAGMALCVDVVLNHTAREHPWAVAAREGDPRRLAFYRTFADRTEPDDHERTLPEVFPDTAPGNFTFDAELGRWVWTTFNAYQWDLDHANPEVFVAMAAAMLDLAAVGVDVLRLDAVPFLWKRKGTDCQNQPEVHDLLQAYRAAVRIAAR